MQATHAKHTHAMARARERNDELGEKSDIMG
jgi:hypothetical protein